MTKKKAVLLLGLVTIIVSNSWVLKGSSLAQPQEGVLDVWTTWAGESDQLQALFDRYTQATGLPVNVTAGVDGRQVSKALSGSTPPDVVILSTADPVGFYHVQGLIEPNRASIVAFARGDTDLAPLVGGAPPAPESPVLTPLPDASTYRSGVRFPAPQLIFYPVARFEEVNQGAADGGVLRNGNRLFRDRHKPVNPV